GGEEVAARAPRAPCDPGQARGARQAAPVGAAARGPVALAPQRARRPALLPPVPDPALAAPATVRGRRVEEGDPRGKSRVHQCERLLPGLSSAEELRGRSNPAEVPAAEPESREFKVGPPEPSTVPGRTLPPRQSERARTAASPRLERRRDLSRVVGPGTQGHVHEHETFSLVPCS